MASISRDPGGRRRILFVDKSGKRMALWLGKTPQRDAQEICRRVELINGAAIRNLALDGETAQWLADIGDELYGKLARAGLVAPRQTPELANALGLGAFVDAFLSSRADLKPNTRTTFVQTRKALVKHFGEERTIDTITAGDADEWAAALRKDYAPATVATFVKRARQMFRHAARKKLLTESPFRETRVPSQVNKSREHFVSHDTIAQVIAAAPDLEWRCIIALARFAGLRCPSELLALKWSAIDWERGRITVFSPKLEHLPSGGVRQMPILPALRGYLEDAFDAAPDGAVYVVRRYREKNANLRTQLLRIIGKAGVSPWGRLFHNLRGSLETELAQDYPVHVVAHWLGNTPKVAAAHYLQVRDCDYDRAAKVDAPDSALLTRQTAQQASVPVRKVSQEAAQVVYGVEETCVFAGNAAEIEYPRQESNL